MNKEQIIEKFEKNKKLSYEELDFFFNGYLNKEVSDIEMTRVLKSICKNELSNSEIFDLVDIFIKSGEVYDLSSLSNVVDKHSTGGVGDKTTLIVAPIVATCGLSLAKLSGKALGYTGGTIDKLNSISVNTELSYEEFMSDIKNMGMSIMSASDNLCPMDKKIYALRDITGTANSISLIAISIMSKKIASSSSKILIDIKVGKGALIKDKKSAIKLAKLMIKIGKKYNKQVICMLTKMNNPLGDNIGNTIEVLEVIDILKNNKDNELRTLAIKMSSLLVSMSKNISIKQAEKEVLSALNSKKAYNKFVTYVKKEGGNLNIKLPTPKNIISSSEGYIKSINSMTIGTISMELGAGRIKKDDDIDYNAGIILKKNIGDYVKKGDILCEIYGQREIDEKELLNAFAFSKKPPKKENIIIDIIK